MADIVRQDVVEIGFEVDSGPIQQVNKSISELQRTIAKLAGVDSFEQLREDAEDLEDELEDVEDQTEDTNEELDDMDKHKFKNLTSGLKSVGGLLGKVTLKAAKYAAVGIGSATAGLTAVVGKSVQAAGELEQNLGGAGAVFGDIGETIDKMNVKVGDSTDTLANISKNAYKTMGVSQSDYLATVNKMGSLMQGSGISVQDSLDLSSQAMQRAADVASIMGIDIDAAMESVAGAAKGNFTMMDNLGVAMNATTIEAYAMKKGIKKTWNEMDNATKIELAMQMFLDKTSYAMGNYSKENETYAGSLTTLKASWQNTLAAMTTGGEDFDNSIDELVNSAISFGKVVMPKIQTAIEGIGKFIGEAAPIIAENLPPLIRDLLPPLVKSAGQLIGQLIVQLPEIIRALIPAVKEAAAEIVKALYEAFTGKTMSDDAFGGIKSAIDGIVPVLKGVIPVVLAVVAAFKGFNTIKSIKSFFGGKGGEKGGDSESGGGFLSSLKNTFTSLAKTKTTTILKGMANLSIILGGMAALTAVFMWIAPYMAKLGDTQSILKIVVVMGALGALGMFLSKIGTVLGKLKVSQVAKGLANMAIMLGGMAAIFVVMGAISTLGFSETAVLKMAVTVGALGIVGGVLAGLGAIIGLIPVSLVAKGLANIAIIMVGMSAVLLVVNAITKHINFPLMFMTIQTIKIFGEVGAVLTAFASILGLVPIPVVLTGLANLGLVLGGMTALIIAFGELTRIPGFTEFLEKGGQVLVKIMSILGEMIGALAGGVIEGISNVLPKVGENLGKFGENMKPLFDTIGTTDMGGVGEFFKALVGLLGIATGNEIVEGIKSFFGGDDESSLAKLGTSLSEFSANAKGFFNDVSSMPEKGFTKATQMFESLAKIKDLPSVGKDGTTSLAAIATDLSTFADTTGGFFTYLESIDTEKLTALWDALGKADQITADSLSKMNEDLTELIKSVGELPKKMGDGIKKSGDSLKTALVSIWKDAVTAVANPINKLISGANWILKEFGSKKVVASWVPYAKGTDGHKGGNALVNDGRGAELVQMPNGKTFIPSGRNVFIPNAPAGMKVLPAEETAQLMGRKSPTFRYADGNIDIWSFIDNAKGLVDSVKSKYVNYEGMSAFAKNIGEGMVTTISGQMTSWAEKLFDEFGALSLADYIPSRGVEQWRSTVIRALKMEGLYNEANVARTLMQMQTESSGNPRAINLWDSNAKKGIPSKGLMQVIDPTFKAYARPGFNTNIYDPLSNILASIRYAVARYGSLTRAYRGVGYANGGLVTKTGMIAENPRHPEWVIPTDPSKRSRALNLYQQAGRSLGLSTYTPEGGHSQAGSVENNTYAPVFNLTISGTSDDRATARKVKKWVKEAMEETFESFGRRSPSLQAY